MALEKIFGLAPPDLYCIGNVELLSGVGVGFCGSRNVSEKGMEVAADCASLLVEHDVIVISGYARGVDVAAHHAALANHGKTIVVLPEGISHFRVRRDLASVWDWDRVLVVSHFSPDAVWRSDRAMERNKLIVGLSRATFVVEAGERGGTLNAGLTALQMQRVLYVADYKTDDDSNAGNRILLGKGALRLGRNKDTGRPNIEKIIENIFG